jgi:starch-binding outer membrane protein, SusD/RagB family
MKRIKSKLLLASGFAVLLAVAACKKAFLDRPPQGTLNPEIVASETGIQGILIGAYAMLDGVGGVQNGGYAGSAASNWVLGGVASDDAYKGSDPTDFSEIAAFEQFTTLTPSNGILNDKWRAMYAGAQRSNDVLRTLAIATDIDPAIATGITAQARFLRGFFHFELKKVYGNIIFADETITPENTAVTNTEDVWPRIEEDLKFAVDNLPETWSDVGRANKWAAMALLAKVYMQQNKQAEAYPLLKDVIANGKTSLGVKYALYPTFYSNFNPQQKNGSESIFAAQTSVQDNSSVDWGGDPNGNYGDILNFPYNGGPGACCGFYNPSQDLGNAFKTDANGLPLLDESYATGPNVSAKTNPYTGNLDPRIDLTMGRPGIPYLDWGLHPGEDWIRNPVNDGRFSPKKNVYAASQKDQYTDVGSAYWGPTELVANNVNLIRFSDVILLAAECAVKAGEIPVAMGYVNMVRERAANPEGWVYKNSAYDAATATYSTRTTPADKYLIKPYTAATFTAANAMTAVRFERRLELAMEGHRFFDLQRYDKESPGLMADVINRYIAREKTLRPIKQNAQFQKGKNEIFPIGQTIIDNMNADGTVRVVQNPNY